MRKLMRRVSWLPLAALPAAGQDVRRDEQQVQGEPCRPC